MGAFDININTIQNKDNESTWKEQLLSTSPYPILAVEKNGTLAYANEAAFPLLEFWRIQTGEKLPSRIEFFIRKVIREEEALEVEMEENERKYLLSFKPGKDGFVYIHGLNLTSLYLKGKSLIMQESRQELPCEFLRPLLLADFRNLMDQTAEVIVSILKIESCRVLKVFHNRADFRHFTVAEEEETGSKATEFSDEIQMQEVGCSKPNNFPGKLAGGISVFLKNPGEPCLVITLDRAMPLAFSPEEVRFLRYILSLVHRVEECRRAGVKLQDRVGFLEALLRKAPTPAYFKDVSETFQSCIELFTTAKAPSGKDAGRSILELEEIIPKELVAIYKSRNRGSSGEFAELTGILPGICVFRESEETLRIALEVQKVLWTVINNSPAVVFLWRNEENWPADFVSENVSLFGYTIEDFTSGKVLYGNIIHREDIDRVRTELDHAVKTGYGGFRTEYRIFTKDGALRWVDERTFIQRNKAGEATYFQGVVIDITERKIAEEAFEQAEQLRKKELNHRIKNNLQIVSSLLDLQAEKFTDSKVIEAFRESESRILSMSLIHQELYESGKLDSLDFSSYLRKLTADLLASYNIESDRIRVKLNVDKVFLGVDTAVSLGIIINELFTNSIKYAFPAGPEGEIRIALFREENADKKDRNVTLGEISPAKEPGPGDSLSDLIKYENFTLIFEDNGIGFPETVNFKNPVTLGFQLVNILVDQIEGSIELERQKDELERGRDELKKRKGTKFVIKFKNEVQDGS